MANFITQETFDEAVIENQDAFDMPVEEAIVAAVQQFQAQGADLSHVITTLLRDKAEFEELGKALENLKVIPANGDTDLCSQYLEMISKECDKSLNFRVFAGQQDAYNIILTTMDKFEGNNDQIKACLKAMASLMTTQPDLLDDRGISVIQKLLQTSQDAETTKITLKWARECCIMQEMNRQKFFEASIVDWIYPILNTDNPEVLQNVCALFRVLILDDDIRVEFGKAHDHARGIATRCLPTLTNLLASNRENEDVMNDLIQTISALLVRDEFCADVKNAGAIEIIRDDLSAFKNSDKFTRICLKFLKVLAGNDMCKKYIVEIKAAPALVTSLRQNLKSAVTAINGLSCIAALTLRSPDNSQAFFEAGAPEAITECMAQHSNNEKVQQSASWAIRNMVSRSRNLCPHFLAFGAEKLLKDALTKFQKSEYDMKSALRDLGCSVSLKEEWTGRGGKLNTEQTKVDV